MIEAIVDNRWNSTFRALKSTIRMRKALSAVRDDEPDHKLAKVVPSDEMFDVFEDLLPGLTHLEDVSDYFCGDLYPTVHMMLGKTIQLKNILNPRKLKTEVGKAFFTKFIEELDQRQPNNGVDQQHVRFACVLHPFFRGTF